MPKYLLFSVEEISVSKKFGEGKIVVNPTDDFIVAVPTTGEEIKTGGEIAYDLGTLNEVIVGLKTALIIESEELIDNLK